MNIGFSLWSIQGRHLFGSRQDPQILAADANPIRVSAERSKTAAGARSEWQRTGRGPRARRKVAPIAADLAQRFLTEHVDVKRKASTVREYHPVLDHVIVPALGEKGWHTPAILPAHGDVDGKGGRRNDSQSVWV
jgi:hypothetical protein